MKCVNCGQDLPESAVFCSNCGALTQTANQAAPYEVPKDTLAGDNDGISAGNRAPKAGITPNAPEPLKKREWKDQYTIGVIVGLCVVAGIIGFMVKSVRNSSELEPYDRMEAGTQSVKNDSYDEAVAAEEESAGGFEQIKEDYENHRMDYAEAKNALMELDMSGIKAEEAEEVLEFEEMLEADLKDDLSRLASDSDYESVMEILSQMEEKIAGEDEFLADMYKKYEAEYSRNSVNVGADGYIIPGSDSRYLTDADISGLNIQQINYAKNEIYARHGRKFQSDELQTYFNSKSWYHGTVEPAAFNEGILNDYEKKNAEKLSSREFSMESGGYKLDQ